MRHLSLVALAALAVAGCEQDFSFADKDAAVGVPNPPDLETPSRTDRIVQVTTPEVDILWVIDDSCSMSEEQAKLTQNFPNFVNFFLDSGLDWHIGVVSTDMQSSAKSGKLQQKGGFKWITPDTPNPVEIFRQMATLGTNGSVDERGRAAAYAALTDPNLSGFNNGFYREDATLHIVVITDEPDYSGSNPSRNEFINWLLALKEDPEMVTFSSIVGPAGGCATAEAGTDYIAVTNAVGGIHESICKNDWVPVLEQLGLQAAGLKREYFLSDLPVPGTIEVWVDEIVNDQEYTYDGVNLDDVPEGSTPADECPSTFCFTFIYDGIRNSIVMQDYVPSPLATINIRYELLAGFQPTEEEF